MIDTAACIAADESPGLAITQCVARCAEAYLAVRDSGGSHDGRCHNNRLTLLKLMP